MNIARDSVLGDVWVLRVPECDCPRQLQYAARSSTTQPLDHHSPSPPCPHDEQPMSPPGDSPFNHSFPRC